MRTQTYNPLQTPTSPIQIIQNGKNGLMYSLLDEIHIWQTTNIKHSITGWGQGTIIFKRCQSLACFLPLIDPKRWCNHMITKYKSLFKCTWLIRLIPKTKATQNWQRFCLLFQRCMTLFSRCTIFLSSVLYI